MFRSKKIFVSLVLGLALVPLLANATITRVRGLGGEHVNTIIKDQANYLIWPQLVKNYGTVANAEFGGGYMEGNEAFGLKSVSANYNWGEEKGVINFALNKMQNTRYTQLVDAVDDGPGVNNGLTVRYGRKLGDNLGGLALYSAWENYEHKEAPKVEQKASVMGLQVGYSLVEQMIDLTLGFEVASFTDEADGATVTEPNGMSSIMFAGRWMYDYSDAAMLVPNVSVNMTSDNAKAPNLGERNISSSHIKLGAGHNWWPADNALVIFDFGIEMMSTETELVPTTGASSKSTESNSYLPYWRVGAETKIFDWLDGRVGAERFWETMVDAGDTPGEESWGMSNTHTYLGASTHWNRLLFDLLVRPDFIGNGVNFISGDMTDNMFTQVSMKFDFNK